jgi:RimJ/RimL family protein N-acetyltransferase
MPRLVPRGPRLRLRPLRPRDLDEVVGWANDADALRSEGRWEPYKPYSREEYEEQWRTVSGRGWVFVGLKGLRRVGEFILTLNGPRPGTARIDLNVAPGFRRHGCGREGVALCALFAFETLGMSAVYGFVRTDNRASMRFHRSLGYRRRLKEENTPFVLSNTKASRRRLRSLLAAQD